MKVTAELKSIRVAPRKAKLVADLVKGMDALEAVNQLDATVRKTSGYLQKLILSAIANGENNFGLSKNNLYVFDVVVGAGPTMKRWMPKAYGRAGEILKRTSKIKVVLEERVEGKDRKSKEQLEKEREERAKKAAEEAKKRAEAQKEEEAKPEKVAETKAKSEEKTTTGAKKGQGWKNRIFNRKSM